MCQAGPRGKYQSWSRGRGSEEKTQARALTVVSAEGTEEVG